MTTTEEHGDPYPAAGAAHVTALLRHQAASARDAVALVTDRGRWTYGQWSTEADRVAAALRRDGVGPGDTVALLAPNSLEWLAVAFGAAAVGARLAPFNTWIKGPELDFLLTFSRPTVLVTVGTWGRQDFLAELREIIPEVWGPDADGWVTARVPSLKRVVVLGAQAPAGATQYEAWLPVDGWSGTPVAPGDDIALVLFTSGSTARPKGVTLTHRDLVANGFEIGERQGLGAEDRLLLSSPLFWSLGSANALFATLTHRTQLVLMAQFDAGRALEVIERERCSAIYTLSVMTHALLDHPDFAPERVASLQRGLTFGPPSELRLVIERLGVEAICNIYGSTEVYGNCVVSPWDAPPEQRIAASGPPLHGVELRLVDPETGAEVGPGGIGEIQVRGRVSPGYLDGDGNLVPVAGADGWFSTGDLGTIDAAGWMAFAGRSSEMIKTAGINVSPAEVEDVLTGHDDVAEAAVTGVAHPVRGEEVVAFVRAKPGHRIDPDAIRAWVSTRAASYKVPVQVVVVDEFPTTSTGKLARRELRALAEVHRAG